MGCDWYDFNALSCTGTAIMVINKGIKEVYKQGSTDEDEEDDRLECPLGEEEIEWILGQISSDFKVYAVGQAFVLITKKNSEIITAPNQDVPGPYEIENEFYCVSFSIKQASPGKDFDELFEIARKLTPEGDKLSFAPGLYSLSMTFDIISIEQLVSVKSKGINGTSESTKYALEAPEAPEAEVMAFSDFELVVGNGEIQASIPTYKAILSCYIPNFDALIGDDMQAKQLYLPDLVPDAVSTVLNAFTTFGGKGLLRSYRSDYTSKIRPVLERFGFKEGSYIKSTEKRAKIKHPAMANPRWLDTTILVGPNKDEIKVNRAVFASLNPVLCKIFYGTGLITTDVTKPIEWLDFDIDAVRLIFTAMANLGREEIVVPVEKVAPVKIVVDYLMETHERLNLFYDTPFKRQFLDGITLIRNYNYETDEDYLRLP